MEECPDLTVETQDFSGRQRLVDINLPEILTTILRFLDRSSLRSCRLVSRLWRHHSDYILGQDYIVSYKNIAKVLLFPEYTLSEVEQWTVNQLQLNAPSIVHMCLKNPNGFYQRLLAPNLYSGPRPTPQMTSLLSLSLGTLVEIPITTDMSTVFNKVIYDMICNSPRLRELKVLYNPRETRELEIDRVLKSAGPSLRKITIQSDPHLEHLGHLFQLILNREHRLQQQNASGDGQLPTDATQSIKLGHARSTRVENHLEELNIIAGLLPYSRLYQVDDFKLTQGQLLIKSLSIEYNPPSQENSELYRLRCDTLLEIVQRCPQLSELRFGSKFITPFQSPVRLPHPAASGKNWIQGLFKACPNLKKIDLGGSFKYLLDHLTDALEVYIGQLESLVVWGLNITPTRPLGTIFRSGAINRLTELNINNSTGFEEAIPAVLKSAPNLKKLFARSVQVNAEDITGYDWVCTNLVYLILKIYVPSDLPTSGDSDIRHSTWSNTESDHALPGRVSYNNALQILVCQQLGRLTRLCELKLEGPPHEDYDIGESKGENCLFLTMETGLPYLEPLKNSLEILDLSRLDDRLNGRQEFEWIAQRWVHHRHPELHPRLSIESGLDTAQLKSLQTEIKILSASLLAPKLRELRGINRKGGFEEPMDCDANTVWLLSVCPTLSIKDPRRTRWWELNHHLEGLLVTA